MHNTEDMLDFNQWWPEFYITKKRGTPRQYNISFAPVCYAEFVYKAAHKHVVVTSEYIDGLTHHTFDLGLPVASSIAISWHMVYPHGKVSLNTKKKRRKKSGDV
ncbi:hypothetical protein PR048_010602 [Dryococelus australis]|uniref:Uncharacterized protein n=1 Tax=Dryococelus australis TaxID=614101 RepID=A0ABQ9I364_9NEOP|nr:hypothetical protein PR048_010602 [Dryococelus australis]